MCGLFYRKENDFETIQQAMMRYVSFNIIYFDLVRAQLKWQQIRWLIKLLKNLNLGFR